MISTSQAPCSSQMRGLSGPRHHGLFLDVLSLCPCTPTSLSIVCSKHYTPSKKGMPLVFPAGLKPCFYCVSYSWQSLWHDPYFQNPELEHWPCKRRCHRTIVSRATVNNENNAAVHACNRHCFQDLHWFWELIVFWWKKKTNFLRSIVTHTTSFLLPNPLYLSCS